MAVSMSVHLRCGRIAVRANDAHFRLSPILATRVRACMGLMFSARPPRAPGMGRVEIKVRPAFAPRWREPNKLQYRARGGKITLSAALADKVGRG